MPSRFALLLIASATATAAAGNATLILDDFDADPNDDAGGPRVLSTTITDNPFGQPSNFEVDTALMIGSDVGAAIFNSGIGVEQEARINWDNNGAGLSLDAAALGLIGFELDFAAIDLDFNYLFRMFDGSGEVVGGTGSFAAGGSRTETIALSDFDLTGFDASDVDRVEIAFNVRGDTASLDFILPEVRAVVPAPGALALLGLGGLAAIRRRR